MSSASVGFHCPECVRNHGQRVYTARSLITRPVVTMALIAANLLVFLAAQASDQLVTRLVLFGPWIAELDEWYRIASSGFLHRALIHVGMNMFLLWMLGSELEVAMGRVRFSVIYAGSLLAGSAGALLVSPTAFTLGASGAVYGLMGAALVAQRSTGRSVMQGTIGTLLVINLVITFVRAGHLRRRSHRGTRRRGACLLGSSTRVSGWCPERSRALQRSRLPLASHGSQQSLRARGETPSSDLPARRSGSASRSRQGLR